MTEPELDPADQAIALEDAPAAAVSRESRRLSDRVTALESWRASIEYHPVPTPAPAARFPADLLGAGWKLTLPSAREVLQPELATYASPEFCLTDDRTGVRLRVHHGGATTKGSPNPRCELREMLPGGRGLARWSTTTIRRAMSLTLMVTRLTKVRPHVVVAQIHGVDDDVTAWRVEGDKLWITDGDNPHAWLADDGFRLNVSRTLEFEVSDGHVLYRLDGRLLDYALRVTDTGCYLKAGAYLQSNAKTAPGESISEYAEVVITALSVSHS